MADGIDKKRSLTSLQRRFCEEYLIDLNATAAYIRAGYRGNITTARVNACKLLTKTNIQIRISQLQEARETRTRIKADNVLREIARLAFSNIEDFCTWDQDGNVQVYPSNEIPPECSAAIRKVKRVKRSIPMKGGGMIEETRLEVELIGKEKSLEMLMRHLGLFKDKVNLGTTIVYNLERNPKQME